ncbi:ATP-binding cassette domain-containing protein [Peptoniphilus raoultii]|uniref:ATP-binding cassette domain-containing protein n=1 Tax=Peptoniphilus raoultii TaxID=1776387 RepID=UPI0008DAAFB5|nr:ATP-binding cassette domain-containing protein [Peptoniphilus raoultii]
MSAIVINDLEKRIGRKIVFDSLNLEIMDGEFYSLLGTKDSGKTTLAKILMGFLKVNKGNSYIYDMDCFKESKEIKESVSLVSSDFFIPDNQKAINIFKKTLSSHNLKSLEDVDVLCRYFDFDDRLKFGEMTDREKKLFQIINALIVKPRLLILDSPEEFLTEDDKDLLFSQLVNLNRGEGTTIFLLTNSLIDAKKYSKRIAYLYNGRVMDVEYNNEKPSYDKILRIYNYRGNLSYFTDAGARLVRDTDIETTLYYDGDLQKLSHVIYDERLDNYSLENASLEDKLLAYYNNGKEVPHRRTEEKNKLRPKKDIGLNKNLDKKPDLEKTMDLKDDLSDTKINEIKVVESENYADKENKAELFVEKDKKTEDENLKTEIITGQDSVISQDKNAEIFKEESFDNSQKDETKKNIIINENAEGNSNDNAIFIKKSGKINIASDEGRD